MECPISSDRRVSNRYLVRVSESALVFSYDKLDLIWPLCANEVIKAELDQMERISVKWSESQYLPSLSLSLSLSASFEQLHGGLTEGGAGAIQP